MTRPDAPAVGNPAVLGMPAFVVGVLTIGLFLVGFQPNGASGAVLVNLISVGFVGLLIATVWAVRAGAGAVAAIFGLLAGFFLSFALLTLGLGGGLGGGAGANVTYFLVWTIAAAVLTLATLRLPLAYTVTLALLTLAFLFLLLFHWIGGDLWKTLAGITLLVTSLVGVYIFLSVASVESGGRGLGLGGAVQK